MSIRLQCSQLFMCAMVAMPLAASAAPRYKVNVLGGAGSTATDINSSGQVVGQFVNAAGQQHGFLHAGAGLLDLGTLSGGFSYAAAINDSGQVVGYANNGVDRAFVYAGGSMSDLGTLGGDSARALAINASGQIAGGSNTGDPSQFGLLRAFVTAGGGLQNIGTLPNGDMSVARGINGAGHVVGVSAISTDDPPEHPSHAFLFDGSGMADLGTLGGLYSSGAAINDNDWVVGQASTAIDYGNGHFVPHAFLYTGGMMIDLGTFGATFAASEAHDVNNLGQVVGWAGTADDRAAAFLYEDGNLLDLNLLIDPASGWVLQDAHGINDMQQIAATGCRDGACFALRLDLANTVPEPGSAGLLAAGLALLGLGAGRSQSRLAQSKQRLCGVTDRGMHIKGG